MADPTQTAEIQDAEYGRCVRHSVDALNALIRKASARGLHVSLGLSWFKDGHNEVEVNLVECRRSQEDSYD